VPIADPFWSIFVHINVVQTYRRGVVHALSWGSGSAEKFHMVRFPDQVNFADDPGQNKAAHTWGHRPGLQASFAQELVARPGLPIAAARHDMTPRIHDPAGGAFNALF
jgi:hypothetical protein